ncbi:MAG: 6-hydroxymethylpterin diphosphokinase MptE-like protein [Fervidicoccaceae archaeon]|nr:MAG: hypothetical protein C0179_02900 [Fervidicoccus sp.]
MKAKKFEPSEWIRIFEWLKKELPLNFIADIDAVKLFSSSISLNMRALRRGYELIEKEEVLVLGAGPELEMINSIEGKRVIVADRAAKHVMSIFRKTPDVLVTDLDGIEDIEISDLKKVPLIIAHLHGDNIEKAQRFLKNVNYQNQHIVYTTQISPSPPFFNLGGFTDGDRAVFVALFFGARNIKVYAIGEKTLPPHNEKPSDNRLKKFWIGKSIVEWLACKDSRINIPLQDNSQCTGFPWEE